MNGPRALLAALVLLGAGVALSALAGHDAALDRDRALLIAETERFGPGTRGRVAAWAAVEHPGDAVRWRAADPALFDDTVPVTLRIGDRGPYRFEIVLGPRIVRPLDDETRGLVARIERWAEAASRGPAAPK